MKLRLGGLIALVGYWIYRASLYPMERLPVERPDQTFWKPPLFVEESSWIFYVANIALLVFAIVVGQAVLRPLFPERVRRAAWEESLFLAAGFVPGYLMIVAAVRLATIAFPNAVAFSVLLLVAGAALYRLGRLGLLKPPRMSGLAILLVLELVLLVHQIHFFISHVAGDSSCAVMNFLLARQNVFNAWGRFPILSQHYDEVAYLFPLLCLRQVVKGAVLLPFWFLGAAGKLGCFGLCFLALRDWLKVKGDALLLSFFLFFGGLFICPMNAIVIFDSCNPIGQALHVGRNLGAVLPFVLLAFLPRTRVLNFRPYSAVVLVLLGLGLGATTISNVEVLLFSAITAWFLLPAKFSGTPLRSSEGRCLELVTWTLLLLPCLAYSASALAGAGPKIMLGTLLVSSLALGFVFRPSLRFSRRALDEPPMRTLLYLGAGAALSIVLLGNILAAKVLGGEELIDVSKRRGMSEVALGVFRYRGSDQMMGSTLEFDVFAAKFGLAFLLLSLTAYWTALKGTLGGRFWRETFGVSSSVLLPLTAVFLLTGFFQYHFLNGLIVDEMQAWVKSRLVEPWYYLALALPLAILLRQGGRIRTATVVFLAIWLVFPQFYDRHNIPRQWWLNAGYLAQRLN